MQKKNNTPLIVYGSGIAKREFIFSKDVSNICLKLLKKYQDDKPVIISNSSEEISIDQIVNLIVEISNFKGEVIYDKTKSDGQLIKKTNNEKLLSVIGDYSFTPIEDGLQQTIEWFFNNYEKAKK